MVKNKLFIVLLIFLLLITTYSSVFAYTTTIETGAIYSYPDNTVEYLKTTNYYNNNYICLGIKWTATSHGGPLYYVFFFEKTDDLKIYWGTNSKGGLGFKSNIGFKSVHYIFKPDGSLKEGPITRDSASAFTANDFWHWFGTEVSSTEILMVNGDIYDYSGNLFFLGPPPIVEEPEEEPSQEVGTKETLQTMGEIAKEKITQTILIVIATVVFLVISLIGVKKGWQILVRGLKT